MQLNFKKCTVTLSKQFNKDVFFDYDKNFRLDAVCDLKYDQVEVILLQQIL